MKHKYVFQLLGFQYGYLSTIGLNFGLKFNTLLLVTKNNVNFEPKFVLFNVTVLG